MPLMLPHTLDAFRAALNAAARQREEDVRPKTIADQVAGPARAGCQQLTVRISESSISDGMYPMSPGASVSSCGRT